MRPRCCWRSRRRPRSPASATSSRRTISVPQRCCPRSVAACARPSGRGRGARPARRCGAASPPSRRAAGRPLRGSLVLGTGVGPRLHHHAVTRIRDFGCRHPSVGAEQNMRARRFYEKRGWRLNGDARIVPFPSTRRSSCTRRAVAPRSSSPHRCRTRSDGSGGSSSGCAEHRASKGAPAGQSASSPPCCGENSAPF